MPKRIPGDDPPPTFQAMANDLNPRGDPYVFDDIIFTPGEWQPITVDQAETLTWYDWVNVAQVEDPPP